MFDPVSLTPIPSTRHPRFPSRLDDGTTRIYYTGQSKDGSTAIGVAKCSGEEASSTFAREQAEFNFAL